jgi:hypothetical protein
MANTVTNTRLFCGNSKVVQYVTIAYVDAQETDLLIYDSSAVATVLGLTDTLNCKIREVQATVNAAAAANVFLEFDATTDVLALSLPNNTCTNLCFDQVGGLKNTSGTGKTGDILLTTTGLDAGDSISLIITIDPR